MRYATAAASRQAFDDRLRSEASSTGLPLARLRKQVAFELFPRRLVAVAPDRFVLEARSSSGSRQRRGQPGTSTSVETTTHGCVGATAIASLASCSAGTPRGPVCGPVRGPPWGRSGGRSGQAHPYTVEAPARWPLRRPG
jgi:hypothetical protein